MARTFPEVLNVFFGRLHSETPEARSHAALALREIARQEPYLLDIKRLRREMLALSKKRDRDALRYRTRRLTK